MKVHSLNLSVGPAFAVAATINDIPFFSHDGGEAMAAELPFEEDVLPGGNVVKVTLGAPHGGIGRSATLPARSGMYAHAVVNAETPTETATEVFTTAQEVAKADWDPDKQGAVQLSLPHVLTLSFTAPTSRGPVWLDAARVDAGGVAPRALALVRSLAAMLARGDVGAFADANRLKYQDLARVYPVAGDAAAQRATDETETRGIVTRRGVSIPDPETLGARFLVYNGRVVDCLAADGKPLLRVLRAGRDPIYFAMKLAQIGGELRVIR